VAAIGEGQLNRWAKQTQMTVRAYGFSLYGMRDLTPCGEGARDLHGLKPKTVAADVRKRARN